MIASGSVAHLRHVPPQPSCRNMLQSGLLGAATVGALLGLGLREVRSAPSARYTLALLRPVFRMISGTVQLPNPDHLLHALGPRHLHLEEGIPDDDQAADQANYHANTYMSGPLVGRLAIPPVKIPKIFSEAEHCRRFLEQATPPEALSARSSSRWGCYRLT